MSSAHVLVALAVMGSVGCDSRAPDASSTGVPTSTVAPPPTSASVALPSTSAPPLATARYTAPACTHEPLSLPLVAADPAIKAKLALVAKCPVDPSEKCEALDAVLSDAKDLRFLPPSDAGDTKIARAASAYVAALEDDAPRVRRAGADALHEVAYVIKNLTVVPRLLDRVAIETDADAKGAMASALARIGTYEAGYHCRTIALIRKLPKSDPIATDLVASLDHIAMTETPDAIFDFAYELLMDSSFGPVSGRAIDLLEKPSPARKAEACERLRQAVRAGVRGFGHASIGLWKMAGCARDVVVPTVVEKLGVLASVTKYDDALSTDVAFFEDFARWPGVTDDQKKAVCGAADSLVKKATDADAKRSGEKIVANCPR